MSKIEISCGYAEKRSDDLAKQKISDRKRGRDCDYAFEVDELSFIQWAQKKMVRRLE